MRKKLEQLAEQMLESEEHYLRGENKPPGLMKTLILKYDEDLGSLIRNTGLQSATLDFRRHRLKVTGTRTSLDKAAAEVCEVTRAIAMIIIIQVQGIEPCKEFESVSECIVIERMRVI